MSGRAKSGTPSVYLISARESRALRRLQRETPASRYVFISERGAPLGVAGYRIGSPNEVMEGRAGIAGLFRLDARELDHLGPFLGFSELAEVGGRSWKHRGMRMMAATGAMSRMKLSFTDGFCLTFRPHFLLS